MEYLIVLANQSNNLIRNSIIQLLNALTKRFTCDDIYVCIQNYYGFHLANQLTIHPIDMNMFENCFEWVTDQLYTTMNYISNCDNTMPMKLRIRQRLGLNALLAIASKSPLSPSISSNSIEKIFKILQNMYKTVNIYYIYWIIYKRIIIRYIFFYIG